MKANRLYWLGRYEERVYMTLHLLRQCYDRMIDGDAEDYEEFWHRLDATNSYDTPEEFRLGMMYDEKNPCSIISMLNCVKDNAILLREDIMSETLSYVELSIAHMNKCKERRESNITKLQPITDWSLSFWGSTLQRVTNYNVMSLIIIGRNVELLDLLVRFNYPFERILTVYEDIKRHSDSVSRIFDSVMGKQLDGLLVKELYNCQDEEYKNKLLKYINHLILV